MTEDFNPNDDLDTEEQCNAYLSWCAENFMRLSQGPRRTYRTGIRCAHWLLVVAVAQMHIKEDTADAEALLEQHGMYVNLARALERQQQRIELDRLIVLRASLDCWEPAGTWSNHLLSAAKCAVAALILIEAHPLIELWELTAPDVWAVLETGREWIAAINVDDDLTPEDFAIARDDVVAAKFTWQRANNLARHVGLPPLSPN